MIARLISFFKRRPRRHYVASGVSVSREAGVDTIHVDLDRRPGYYKRIEAELREGDR